MGELSVISIAAVDGECLLVKTNKPRPDTLSDCLNSVLSKERADVPIMYITHIHMFTNTVALEPQMEPQM